MILKEEFFLKRKMSLQVWTEGTMIAAIGVVLSYIPIQTANSSIDLSLGLVPLVLYSAEVQRLRAENDYLKNLQALVLEDERHQHKKRW